MLCVRNFVFTYPSMSIEPIYNRTMKLLVLLGLNRDGAFDYKIMVDYFRKLLNKYVRRRPSLPDDVRLGIYRPLYEKEGRFIVAGLCNVVNNKAHNLHEQNKSLTKNKQVYIPSPIRIQIDPNDKKEVGGFLKNISVQLGISKEVFDKEEGTITISDSPMGSRVLRKMAIPDDVLLEQIDEQGFMLTFKWLDNSRFERTLRSFEILGSNSEQKIMMVGNLCLGTNYISGPNGGDPSDANRIRLSSDEFPMDFLRVDVLSNSNVTITLLDSHLNADVDGVPLESGRSVPIRVGSILNLGLCTLKLA